MNKMKIFASAKQLLLFLLISGILCASILAVAALSFSPEKRGEGKEAESIEPKVSGVGDSAEVIVPKPVGDETGDDEPYEPFIPSFNDDEDFVDMDTSIDFSKQYDYSYAGFTAVSGNCSVSDGTFTATAANSMCVHRSSYAPFPYGTISADVMNNGSDSGIVFGLSSVSDTFWEGAGVSYYFAFVNYEGILFLGRTTNGIWSSLTYVDIPGFNATNTYNLKVLYRVDKIILFLDGEPMLYYRADTPLSGTGWGIRLGAVDAQISNINISNKVTVE